jgi:hypothetical protein
MSYLSIHIYLKYNRIIYHLKELIKSYLLIYDIIISNDYLHMQSQKIRNINKNKQMHI